MTPRKYKELYDHEEIIQFLKFFKLYQNKLFKGSYISGIGRYLKFRKLSIKEFLILLDQEPEKEIEEVAKHKTYLKKNGKTDYTRFLRRFLRYKGLRIPSAKKPKQEKIYMHFIDDVKDKYMVEFMGYQEGLAESSRRKINKSLYDFCLFHDLTPTKLYDQVKKETLSAKQLGTMIVKFSHARKNPNEEEQKKFGWKKTGLPSIKMKSNYIKEFFKMVCEVKPIYKPGQIGKTKSGMDETKRKSITKAEIKQISEKMNLQQKCLLFGLFESGLNAADLTKVTYDDIKHAINFDANLEETKDCVAFFNRRKKSNVGHIAVIGKQTLYYLQQKLSERIRMYSSHGKPYQIQDDELVFSENNSVFRKLHSGSITKMIKKKTLSCGLEKITCIDFRRTFMTLLAESDKLPVAHQQILEGHTNKLMSVKHYTVSENLKFEKFYLRSYFECFFLDYDDVKYKPPRSETKTQEEEIIALRQQMADMREEYKKYKESSELLLAKNNLEETKELEEQQEMTDISMIESPSVETGVKIKTTQKNGKVYWHLKKRKKK